MTQHTTKPLVAQDIEYLKCIRCGVQIDQIRTGGYSPSVTSGMWDGGSQSKSSADTEALTTRKPITGSFATRALKDCRLGENRKLLPKDARRGLR